MKTFKINITDNEKKYVQLYNYIKSSILNGELSPMEPLPSKRVLAKDLGLSLNTIVEAYNLLLFEGFIFSVEKKGYFVVDYNLKTKKLKQIEFQISNKPLIKYDFTTKNVDSKVFPFNKWMKIQNQFSYSKETLIQSPNKGLMKLRQTISHNIFETKGININPDNIVVGCGVEYLLSIVTKLIDNKNYIVENPGYNKIPKILKNNNCNVKYQNLDDEGVIIKDINNSYNIYTTPASEFPMGILMSMKRKKELLEYVENNNTFVVEDDFDSEYKYSSTSTPLLALNPNRVIFLKTFSRTIAPSFRLAYMVLPDRLISIYDKLFSFYSNTVSTLYQLVLNEFFVSGSYYRHLNKTRALYKQKKENIIKLLSNYQQYIKIINSTGLLSILVKLINIDISQFKKDITLNNIDISFIKDEMNKYNDYLIIGYSSIDLDLINESINLLVSLIVKDKIVKKKEL